MLNISDVFYKNGDDVKTDIAFPIVFIYVIFSRFSDQVSFFIIH